MPSIATKRALATALAGAALVSVIGADAVSARPVEEFIPGAAGAGQTDAPPPSSIAAPAGKAYEDLRAPRAGDAGQPDQSASSQPVVDDPSRSDGFDLGSAAIGAGAAGLLLIVLAAASRSARLGRLRPLRLDRQGSAGS